MNKIYKIIGLVLAIILLAGVVAVKASPSAFLPTTQSASATTTVSYLTPGTATTSLIYDSFSINNSGSVNKTQLTDMATLFIQLAASTTATKLNINLEYSQDGIDWFQDGGNIQNGFATTSKPFDIGQVSQYNFSFASSTAGLGGAATIGTTTRAISVRVPTRYLRAVYSLAIGGGNGAVWSQIIPSRQFNQ